VDTNRHAHQHVLGAFHDLAVDLEQIGPFQCFEAKVVVLVITVVNDG
jgi:hypothetical protein